MPENNIFFRQVMQRYTTGAELPGIDAAFIEALLCAFGEKPFCAEDFDAFPIEMIVEYIRRTHVFYLQTKLPEIEQSIFLLSGLYASHHPILAALHNFFQAYSLDLEMHIQAEETLLLPYIGLMSGSINEPGLFPEYILARERYSVARFLASHHDTEDELADIRRTIRLYEPPATNASLYRILLTQLQTFEQDLCVHACIEDQVLIPKAMQMETALNGRLDKLARWN